MATKYNVAYVAQTQNDERCKIRSYMKGDWSMKDDNAQNIEYVAGVYKGRVLSVFHVKDAEKMESGRWRFTFYDRAKDIPLLDATTAIYVSAAKNKLVGREAEEVNLSNGSGDQCVVRYGFVPSVASTFA